RALGEPTGADGSGGSGGSGEAGTAEACRAALEACLAVAGAGAPLLLTCRTRAEGGRVALPDGDYEALLLSLLEGVAGTGGTAAVAAAVAAIDVEVERGCLAAVAAAAHGLGIDVVGSFHDVVATPPDARMEAVLSAMASHGADLAKIAVMPADGADVVRLLGVGARAQARLSIPVAAISMGALGAVSRVAPVFGSALTFAVASGPASAPGQLPIEEVRRVLALLAP
ncbi:type I 3-dehydroquinate dehydratase, partial [Actinomyces slackii]